MPWHVSIGVLLLVLVVLRLMWVASQRHQRPVHEPTTAKLVIAGHGLLYACMLLLPLAGIMIMIGGGYGLTAFGFDIFAEGEKVAREQLEEIRKFKDEKRFNEIKSKKFKKLIILTFS